MQLINKNLSSSPIKKWYKKWWGIFLIIFLTIIAALIVALGFYIFDIVKKMENEDFYNKNFLNQLQNSKKYEIEEKNNYWLGTAKPKVTIVEFADFNCPLCKNSFPKIREISLKYKNDVKIIYRDFPLYENSLDLALAARCAGEQGLFWLMHDKFFQNQGNFDLNQLPDLANQIGADINKFNDCLAQKKYLKDVQIDYSDALSLEVKGTPTWFINGYKISGDIPYDLFIQIIEKLINDSSSAN